MPLDLSHHSTVMMKKLLTEEESYLAHYLIEVIKNIDNYCIHITIYLI